MVLLFRNVLKGDHATSQGDGDKVVHNRALFLRCHNTGLSYGPCQIPPPTPTPTTSPAPSSPMS